LTASGGRAQVLFTENETNTRRLYSISHFKYVKDAFRLSFTEI
jgi:hypothetical protein